MTRKEYYGRIVSVAARNTLSHTGISFSVWAYILASFLVGGLWFCYVDGASKFAEKWHDFVIFTIVGGMGVWLLVFIACLIAAPFQVHQEDFQKLGSTDSRKLALGDLFSRGIELRERKPASDDELEVLNAEIDDWTKQSLQKVCDLFGQSEGQMFAHPQFKSSSWTHQMSPRHGSIICILNARIESLRSLHDKL